MLGKGTGEWSDEDTVSLLDECYRLQFMIEDITTKVIYYGGFNPDAARLSRYLLQVSNELRPLMDAIDPNIEFNDESISDIPVKE